MLGFYRALPWGRYGRKLLVFLITGCVGLELERPIYSRPGKQTLSLGGDREHLRTWVGEATFTPTRTGKVGQPPEAGAQVKTPPLDYHHHHTFSRLLVGLLLPNNDGVFPPACRKWCSGTHGL